MTDIADRLNDLPPRDPSKPDTEQGLFQKFIVTRTDGSSGPGGKHEGCEYFVLDIDHDPLHKPALQAYADACESTHPQLAADLRVRYRLEPRETPPEQVAALYSGAERILRLRAHAFGLCRDLAERFAQDANDGTSSVAVFRRLASHLLSEPEVIDAIANWRQAAREAVDAVDQAPIPAGYSDHERPRATLARHEQLAVRCTLSAHHEEWWRLHREFEQSQRELVALMADGFKARRKAAAGMNLSEGKPAAVHASPVIVETTALWAGAQTAESDGAVHFTREAWVKFVKCLGEEPPLEILTSPGISAPASAVYDECAARGCREDRPCAQGECARGPQAGAPT